MQNAILFIQMANDNDNNNNRNSTSSSGSSSGGSINRKKNPLILLSGKLRVQFSLGPNQ